MIVRWWLKHKRVEGEKKKEEMQERKTIKVKSRGGEEVRTREREV